ncbi:MAG: ribulokinase [Alistipes sp.]|nr:ribulokinase [Alistipes sp.]
MIMKNYLLGVDFGSDSVRCLVVNAADGEEVATAVRYYPRWRKGLYCDPAENRYRQHPLDYIESLEGAICEALAAAGADVAAAVRGIAVDTTASTPVLVNREGVPLALLAEYAEHPDAMFVLWKDHTAVEEAEAINRTAAVWHTNYTQFCGGAYSSEWVWAKVLHCLRHSPELVESAYSWTELCDWVGAMLAGDTAPESIKRGRCVAGHKAMWNEAWGGLPERAFLEAVDPLLGAFSEHLYDKTYTCGTRIGTLCAEWAARLGLSEDVAIGVGAVDCHTGAVGAGVEEGVLVKVIGTSTCDITVVDGEKIGAKSVRGICGQVEGSVLPDYVGIEAGQSAFGDIYAWFRRVMEWPLRYVAATDESLFDRIIPALTAEAEQLPLTDKDPVVVDWFNGRRSPDEDPRATGSISAMTLATSAPGIFKALVEGTAFGSRAIAERLVEEGVSFDRIYAVGGISKKSRFVMQTLCDVLQRPVSVVRTEQACALGAAMFASVAAGIYPDVATAQRAMQSGFSEEYLPNAERKEIYDKLYERYKMAGR